MSDSTYKFVVQIPYEVRLVSGEILDREGFYSWVWQQFSKEGLVGIHEGTLLSEEVVQLGFEADSWTVDSGLAPRERDWVGHQNSLSDEFYFSQKPGALKTLQALKTIAEVELGPVEEQVQQDWDAQWKASFLNNGEGVLVEPFWHILPPWKTESPLREKTVIKINPGAGFGTGTHETTQLCLEALGKFCDGRPSHALRGQALDFGSGSGILSAALALLGHSVNAVEIDPLANDNAAENARLNLVEDQVQISEELPEKSPRYRYVVANILKPVLLEFSSELVERLHPEGTLILSGLIEKDIPQILEVYEKLVGISATHLLKREEWRAVVFIRGLGKIGDEKKDKTFGIAETF